MLRTVTACLLLSFLLATAYAGHGDFTRCNCDDEGSAWTIESILECQRVSDFLIAVAYFSIPIELLYFISCSNVPFKWVLVQFIAFIVLCGMTHLLNGWTYGPHPFQVMVALTVFKILTAFVSCATAITLITLIPLLLKVKVREFMLKKKARELDREVGIIMKQREAGLHVRMLTHEIRKSLDRHTILYTTLVELSKTLGLQNCAVWMPNESKTELHLTHELRGRNYSNSGNLGIRLSDPDVERIRGNDGVNILGPDSSLAMASCGNAVDMGPVAAIRMPMLQVANFKGGTPENVQASYAILVLVLPDGNSRSWTNQELEIIKVVADQVAVALSHAAVLEDSQLMREKLEHQNRALQLAKRNAMMASEARNSFQKVIGNGMRQPMHAISGLLSVMNDASNFSNEQKMIVDAMARTADVLSTLINDMMGISSKDNGRFLLQVRHFRLHAMIRDMACLAKCMCNFLGFGFTVDAEKSLQDNIVGDDKRVIQIILHMIGKLLSDNNRGGSVMLRVSSVSGSQDVNDQRWAAWRQRSSSGDVHVKFEIGLNYGSSKSAESASGSRPGPWYNIERVEQDLGFSICKRLAQMMHGDIWVAQSPQGLAQSMALVLRFQIRSSVSITSPSESSEHPHLFDPMFRTLRILLADHDNTSRAVSKKLLEKLGCAVSMAASGYECLTAASSSSSSFHVVFLSLLLPDLDGIEVARRIRKIRSHNSPLMIALTASEDDHLWERCSQAGFNGVLRKPAVLRVIADELRRVVSQAN
ncbi:hypothetical protein MLD38_018094 [Melastoma candidum]|uniref:Uncharacterized protein n=1 Tax=Melastoma candidum TaxID=119954 RepID=A0ACB9QWT1_9MYRT|nr:hypothetical protein MLD38_018094 [Melastoma candidum]